MSSPDSMSSQSLSTNGGSVTRRTDEINLVASKPFYHLLSHFPLRAMNTGVVRVREVR